MLPLFSRLQWASSLHATTHVASRATSSMLNDTTPWMLPLPFKNQDSLATISALLATFLVRVASCDQSDSFSQSSFHWMRRLRLESPLATGVAVPLHGRGGQTPTFVLPLDDSSFFESPVISPPSRPLQSSVACPRCLSQQGSNPVAPLEHCCHGDQYAGLRHTRPSSPSSIGVASLDNSSCDRRS